MTAPRVWAPRAARVDLVVDDRRRPMQPAGGGWWSTAEDLAPGARYAFSLDGGPPRPDPRATRQPLGVHGPSEAVDQGAFAWTDDGWRAPDLRDGVVYELHIGTFSAGGTFDGAIDHLDELVELGISHVELMPVHSFPGRRGWGYDSVGLYAPHEPYGGPDGLKRLVDACHRRGLAVILDVVYNHFGPEGNYLPEFGPYLTERLHTPWGAAVNLGDAGSDEVRRFLIDNALGWFRDYHVDALRLDAVHAFVDLSATHLLEDLAAEVRRLEADLDRPLTLVAESDLNDPRLLRDPAEGGYGIDFQWSDDFHHAVHVALTGERRGYYGDFTGLPDIARALERIWVYEGRYAPSRDRRHGRSADGLAAGRFLGYLQDHDQVGNRARGDRIGSLVRPDRLRVGAALVLTAPFVPLLFQGEEWGAGTPFPFFADFEDPVLARAVREGRRREFAAFGWSPDEIPDPLDPATFASARLDRSERTRPDHADLLAWYRRLIRLRRETPGLRDGRRAVTAVDARRGHLVVRRSGAIVLVNLGATADRLALPPSARIRDVTASSERVTVDGHALALPPASVAIVRLAAEGVRGEADEV